jgi:hypothetical protein
MGSRFVHATGRIVFLLTASVLLFGGTVYAEDEVFAPFISKIDARVRENGVILSWRDSSAAIDHYEVYRSPEKITRTTFSTAKKVAEVEPGKESYTDYPPTTDPYYYAVLAAEGDGQVYELFIPYRNITVSSIEVATTSSPEERATKISSISAEVREDSVIVEFDRNKPDRPVIVYRSTSPLDSVEDLVDAQAITTVTSTENRLTDFPLPGISYYYAVFDAQLAKAGTYSFETGSNTTAEPVEVPLDQSAISTVSGRVKRSTPLPYLYLSESVLTGRELPGSTPLLSSFGEPQPLASETVKVYDALLKKAPEESRSTPSPVILPADRSLDATGADYHLAKMVQEGFDSEDWNGLSEELEKFLRVDHTDTTESRARFYLGQSYFFRGQYRKAFLEFSIVREKYRVETDRWISVLYDRLAG